MRVSFGVVSLSLVTLLAASAGIAGCSSSGDSPAPNGNDGGQTDGQSGTMSAADLGAAVDAYMDTRFAGAGQTTEDLITLLATNKVTIEGLETALRAPRQSYADEDPRGAVFETDIVSDHVDKFKFHAYVFVPVTYDPAKPSSFVFVGHGGNSAMAQARANEVAKQYIDEYKFGFGRDGNMIVVAPATTRGWGGVGNSTLFSTISWASRRYNIDSEHVYVTGQSMGGHLSYRTALNWSDRFGAFGPQSGGYNYPDPKYGAIAGNLFDAAGYATFGTTKKDANGNDIGELYGIDTDNLKIQAYVAPLKYDWMFVQKPGGHEIFPEEHPKMVAFFNAHPRNLYKKRVFFKTGGTMQFASEGNPGWSHDEVAKPGTILRWNTRYWLELEPRADGGAQTVAGTVADGNQIKIDAFSVEKIRVHLHPKMGIDFSKPVAIFINGDKVFEDMVKPDMHNVLNNARELDDRGRIFYASVEVTAKSSKDVPDPSY